MTVDTTATTQEQILELDGRIARLENIFPLGAMPPKTIMVVYLSEDPFNGDARFSLKVDGKVIVPNQPVTVLHSSGKTQPFSYTGPWGPGDHTVVLTFLNDSFDATTGKDRNLYLHGLDFAGKHYIVTRTFSTAGNISIPVTV